MILPYFRAALPTQKDSSTVLHKQAVFQNLQHCPQVAVQRASHRGCEEKGSKCTWFAQCTALLQLKETLSWSVPTFLKSLGLSNPSNPFIHRDFSADTCPRTSSGIHKPDRAVVGLYYVACAHCLSRKQTKPLQNTPFPLLIMKNCSVPIARNSSKSRQALVPTSLKYNLRGIIVSIIKGSFFFMGKPENQMELLCIRCCVHVMSFSVV